MARINNINRYKQTELNDDSILLGSTFPNGETVNYNIVDIALFVAGYIGDIEAGVQSIQAGDNITVDNTDPKNPIISSTGGGIEDMPDVSAIERGVVNNTPLQELGGVDKLINGIRIGRGSANEEGTTVFGKDALASNTTGEDNTAIGVGSLIENTTGSSNTGIGAWTLYSNTSGNWNFAGGHSSLWRNTTGSRNTAINAALDSNTTGSHNSSMGVNSGYSNTTGSYNTYIGYGSAYNNGIGGHNIALGYSALITSGAGAATPTVNQNRNVFIGSRIRGSNTQSDTFAVDNKGTTITNAENALLYGGFSNANRFLRINGRFEIDDTTMPTADVDFTKKLVWNPTTGVVGITDDSEGGGGTSIHNELTGIQGGSPNEYYHFNEIQHEKLLSLIYTNGTSTISVSPSSGERGVNAALTVNYNITSNDDVFGTATINQGIGDVTGDIDTGNQSKSGGNSTVNKTFTMSLSYTRNGEPKTENKTATYNTYIPQWAGWSAEEDFSNSYSSINSEANFQKYIQSSASINKASSPTGEYIWFISNKNNATIKDTNDFVQTVGTWGDGTSEFYRKPLTLTLADGVTTATVYLYRSRNVKTLSSFTYKIS